MTDNSLQNKVDKIEQRANKMNDAAIKIQKKSDKILEKQHQSQYQMNPLHQ